MNATAAGPLAGMLAQRESGLIVPAHLAGAPEEPDAAGKRAAADEARDPDGRRRLVMSRETRKHFMRVAGDSARDGVMVVLVCQSFRSVPRTATDPSTGETTTVQVREPIAGRCGHVMVREGEGTMDPGFGCECTRVHFLAGSY